MIVADLEDFDVIGTYVRGRLVAADGTALFTVFFAECPNRLRCANRGRRLSRWRSGPGASTSWKRRRDNSDAAAGYTPTVRDGRVVADPDRDLPK